MVNNQKRDKLHRAILAIVNELVAESTGIYCPSAHGTCKKMLFTDQKQDPVTPLSREELFALPEDIRPQLTGQLMKVNIVPSSHKILLQFYYNYLRQKDPRRKAASYAMFRRGLDLFDLDPVIYKMLGMNRNSMGYWLPAISVATDKHNFFKIPETKVVKVPIQLLQMTRLDYNDLTPATLKIANDWAMKVFDLDVHKTYFIKTGVFSSKYDFRNAKVTGEDVRILGEKLLFIHYQATCMASGALSSPSIYGAATTNEWVVREYIEDKENSPCIYGGRPLHTEYRVFVDFDKQCILGVTPYWNSEAMKKRFPTDNIYWVCRDYIADQSPISTGYVDMMRSRYKENVDQVVEEVKKLLPDTALRGQWSIDIMQNGEDFWLLDMAEAAHSALREYIAVDTPHA